ncbi:bifunctional diguanylate cyclase/phosphodiesterase [Noviherbaspirillum sp. UKPF54]|uniref:putative bifunctional diguanylate cyclase/phosphodiesterase n=1 Tax=Noviherbaspirillum sp. UKPF54 TaxID=2601898 RepID=UPI0011B13918|nr:EAL domain-containing protein [Noviherbaspirillum sp. UKPF54]QDZ30090.1 EAL domain-containing protein [Noviherbaspirillum sp. UKPF54]
MFLDKSAGDIQDRYRELVDILDRIPIGILVAGSGSGELLLLNRAGAELLEHPPSPGRAEDYATHFRAIHEDGSPYTDEEYPLVRALKGETVYPEEMLYVRGDGRRGCLQVTASPVRDEQGRTTRVIETLCDVSREWQARQQRTQAHLADLETKLRLAAEIAGLGFWEWDVRNNETYFSPQWKRHLGYRDDELPNRYEEWESRVHPADRARVLAGLESELRSGASDYQVQFRMQHRDGSYRWIEARAQVQRDAQGQPLRMVGTHIDISDHKEREEQVRLTAQHDRLTGLPNRALTFELAEQSLSAAHRSGKMCAALFLDLDGFKPINDTYGHHIGDEVLKEVAQRLKGAFRAQDTVGRIGGDEFLVVLTQVDAAPGAVHAATHVLHHLSLPYHIGDLVLRSSPSIGISMYPQDGTDIETLVRHADAAMYEVKQHGKAGYRFYADSGTMQPDAMQLQHRLRESMAHQSLQLYFQPMVNLSTRQVIAAEALLRWPTPQGVAMSPDMFVAIAEQSGFIDELSNWVLQAACAQHDEWKRQGLPAIDIGINLSPSQLREAGLPDAILQQIARCPIEPDHLWIEISDRALNGGTQYALAALDRLKALGVRIALDDFGAGYLTLEQLSRLPFDRVKIDRTLITALPHDKACAAVTEAAISFGNSLGIEVVAEGLESQQALQFLQERDCHYAQGFYLARPMPGPQFAEWYSHAGLH